MLSSGGNLTNDDDSIMPGDYELWPPRQPMVPPTRTPFPRLPPPSASTARFPGRTPFPRLPSTPGLAATLPGRTPFPRLPPTTRRPPLVPRGHFGRSHRRRRRSLTPEIVIDRPRRHHSSWGGRRVIHVSFDQRPTLGLRGPPRRCIEIERVRCLRRRRPRSECYDYDYEYDHRPPIHPATVVANPITIPSSLVVAHPSVIVPTTNNTAAGTSAFLSNLTPEIINNLPRQTVHLAPIHLPGSQADANTELHTVVYPAEIINPADGTLSIIQVNPTINQGFVTAPVQPQFFHIPTSTGAPVLPRRPPVSPGMAADPLMQRFTNLFQRLSLPQAQPISPAPNPPVIRPTLPDISEFNPTNNPLSNTTNFRGYPSTNIRPHNSWNTGSYRPTSIAPTIPGNLPAYRPPSIPSSGSLNNVPYSPVNNTGYRPSTFTPSAAANNTTYRPPSTVSSNPSDIVPYEPANITPYTSINNRSSNNLLTRPSTPSSTFTPFPRLNLSSSSGVRNNSLNPSSSFPSLAPTLNQPIYSTPKSILRNTTSNAPSNTIYTRLNSPNDPFKRSDS